MTLEPESSRMRRVNLTPPGLTGDGLPTRIAFDDAGLVIDTSRIRPAEGRAVTIPAVVIA